MATLTKTDVVLWPKHLSYDQPLRRSLDRMLPGDVSTIAIDGTSSRWQRMKSQPTGALTQGFKPADERSKNIWRGIAIGQIVRIEATSQDIEAEVSVGKVESVRPTAEVPESPKDRSVEIDARPFAKSRPIVWAVEIGSIRHNRLAWCRLEENVSTSGRDIWEHVSDIAADLADSRPVALGFECPLFVPITKDPVYLTNARKGEGSSAWLAGAGCGALATGLTESVWILEQIRHASAVPILPTFNWIHLVEETANLFL